MKDILKENTVLSEKTAVALGIFDGMHIGHRSVIDKVCSFRSEGLKTAVFTFNSEEILTKHNKPFRYIYKNQQKLDILEKSDIDYICCPEFDSVRNMGTAEFAERILKEKLNAAKVVCGKRFRFGRNAAGDYKELYKLGLEYGFEVIAVPPVLDGDISVSSSAIRSLLSDGRIEKANRLLGRNYEIYGEVVYGNQLGRTIGLPTANISFSERQLIPHYGVYASETVIDGRKYLSVTDIGTKPTVEKDIKPLSETHIIDYSGDIYGKKITVILNRMLRNEMKFSSVEELKNAVNNDIRTVINCRGDHWSPA